MISSTPEWIARSVSRLRIAAPAADKAGDKLAKAAVNTEALNAVSTLLKERLPPTVCWRGMLRGRE